MTAVLIVLFLVAIALLIVFIRGRGARRASPDPQTPAEPGKPDTTLGALHDMREALRPLEHVRAASRRDPKAGNPRPRGRKT